MFIETLTLKNFRQFRGKHALRFSQGRKNVTVVFGENGRGKTGIFRALVFCLFGDRQLSQDGTEIDEREVHLVNTGAVQESRKSGKPVEGGVELVFTHADHRYTLKRFLQSAVQQDGERLEEQTELLLTIEKPDGNCQVLHDPEDIRDRIRGVIDYRVREYFLFDGEKIENLTRASQQGARTN